MRYRRFTESEKAEIWERLRGGESVRSVAAAFGHFPSAVRKMQGVTGGMKPANRHRRENALSLDEREEISRGLAARVSIVPTRLTGVPGAGLDVRKSRSWPPAGGYGRWSRLSWP